jgi:hypothetical protein
VSVTEGDSVSIGFESLDPRDGEGCALLDAEDFLISSLSGLMLGFFEFRVCLHSHESATITCQPSIFPRRNTLFDADRVRRVGYDPNSRIH